MLAPKKVKWRKMQKGRRKGMAWRGATLAFGDYGLQAIERGWLTAREIEAARVALTRYIKRGGRGRREPRGCWSGARGGSRADVGPQRRQGASTGRAPRSEGGRARERSSRPTGSGGIGAAERAQRASRGRAPRSEGGRARERSSGPTGSGGIGAAEPAQRACSGRAARSARCQGR